MTDENLILSDDDLAFLRMTCEAFPVPESPLIFLDEEDRLPKDPRQTYASLVEREYVRSDGTGAVESLRRRVLPVTECQARVSLALRGETAGLDEYREYFVSEGLAVEYACTDSGHSFGSPVEERDLASLLSEKFRTAPEGGDRELRLSAGDYLVFAVFARDVRRADAEESPDTMSVEEVLSYFDEPESPFTNPPQGDSWSASVNSLAKLRVLVERDQGFELHPSLHPLARELAADRQSIVRRFDFLDDQWLMREINLYPTSDTVYRLGTSPDGSVVIQELSISGLERVFRGVVSTLPKLIEADYAA